MGKIFKNKIFLGFAVLFILLVLATGIYLLVNKDDDVAGNGEGGKIVNVEPNDVFKLYNMISDVDCDRVLTWDLIDNQVLLAKDIEDDVKIRMILALINVDGNLTEELTLDTFNKYSKMLFGNAVSKNITYKKTTFNNKEYDIANTKTTIKDNGECAPSNYAIKQFGYTYNEDELSLDVAVGIVKDNKLYNMKNEAVGNISGDNINDLLDNSTIYRYGYKLENDNYYLSNIRNVVTVKVPETN